MEYLREPMGLENKFVGYVYLLDQNCKASDVSKVVGGDNLLIEWLPFDRYDGRRGPTRHRTR